MEFNRTYHNARPKTITHSNKTQPISPLAKNYNGIKIEVTRAKDTYSSRMGNYFIKKRTETPLRNRLLIQLIKHTGHNTKNNLSLSESNDTKNNTIIDLIENQLPLALTNKQTIQISNIHNLIFYKVDDLVKQEQSQNIEQLLNATNNIEIQEKAIRLETLINRLLEEHTTSNNIVDYVKCLQYLAKILILQNKEQYFKEYVENSTLISQVADDVSSMDTKDLVIDKSRIFYMLTSLRNTVLMTQESKYSNTITNEIELIDIYQTNKLTLPILELATISYAQNTDNITEALELISSWRYNYMEGSIDDNNYTVASGKKLFDTQLLEILKALGKSTEAEKLYLSMRQYDSSY